jgi:hypothetical protein
MKFINISLRAYSISVFLVLKTAKNRLYESLKYLDDIKEFIHIGAIRTNFIFSKKGYSIIAEPFLVTIGLEKLRFVYEIIEIADENIDSIMRYEPFCVGYAGGKYKWSYDFQNYLSTDYDYLDEHLKAIGLFVTQHGYESEKELVNIYSYAPYHNKESLFSTAKKKNAVLVKEVKDTLYTCFDSNHISESVPELSDEIPVITEYSIKIIPKDFNNLMLQLIREYLMETSDDIWIPFDMEERKKKFPKAFRELARFMK